MGIKPERDRILLVGHGRENLHQIEGVLPGLVTLLEIHDPKNPPHEISSEIDAAVFYTSIHDGISQSLIYVWNYVAERMIPRLLVISIKGESESDFDDIVLIARRTLEEMGTPFLVMHSEDGRPIGLIDIVNSVVTDYSEGKTDSHQADSELQNLVVEFREEYLELIETYSEDGFAQGLVALAIPVDIESGLGVDKIKASLSNLTKL